MWIRIKPVYILISTFALLLIIFMRNGGNVAKTNKYYHSKFQPSHFSKYAKLHKALLVPVFNKNVPGNYEILDNDSISYGLGDNGIAVNLGEDHKESSAESVKQYGFNIHLSDMISLDRRIKDTRPLECKNWHYPSVEKLPTASVVIVYFNEGWSVIARTVHSVINTSPKQLIKDIILVDDGSTYKLHKNLTSYCQQKWGTGLIKTMRNPVRLGLIKARVQGAMLATGDVIVILDAHCECVKNWLPPLLTEISINPKTLAIPIVDGIDHFTFGHHAVYDPERRFTGIWEWGFLYKETPIPQAEAAKHKYISEPYWSPTHAGGLLAINREWFFELGGYDEGIKIWGGEQYELSFKTWLCGGVLKWVPCSHIAHIYRGPRQVFFPNPNAQTHQTDRNHLRLSAIWMDDYQKYYRIREPLTSKLSFGSISEQLALKKKLQCKSFDWFMKNIAYIVLEKYPVPPENVAFGNLKNQNFPVCMDQMGAKYGEPIKVSKYCNQWFRLNTEGELSTGEHCFKTSGRSIINRHCLSNGSWKPTGEWAYDNVKKQMKSKETNECLDTDGTSLYMSSCDSNLSSQRWIWIENYYS